MEFLRRVLIFDTSGRVGRVAIGEAGRIIDVRVLLEARRHARDLPMRTREMLLARNWKPGDVMSVVVSVGPGSYTGLRVGIASAKAFAYSTGCALFAAPTFDTIAIGMESADDDLQVVADAQQGKIYVGRYNWSSSKGWRLREPIAVVGAADWARGLAKGTRVTGPGLELVVPLLGKDIVALDGGREATPEGILAAIQSRPEEYRATLTSLEPIYLRGSSAEEKRKRAAETTSPRD